MINSTQGQKYFKTEWIEYTLNFTSANRTAIIPLPEPFRDKDALSYFSKIKITAVLSKSAAFSSANGYAALVGMDTKQEEVTITTGQKLSEGVSSAAVVYFATGGNANSDFPSATSNFLSSNTIYSNSMFDVTKRYFIAEMSSVVGFPALIVVSTDNTGNATATIEYQIEGWA